MRGWVSARTEGPHAVARTVPLVQPAGTYSHKRSVRILHGCPHVRTWGEPRWTQCGNLPVGSPSTLFWGKKALKRAFFLLFPEKSAISLHFLQFCYLLRYFTLKTRFYARFKHFSWKKVQFSCNFLQKSKTAIRTLKQRAYGPLLRSMLAYGRLQCDVECAYMWIHVLTHRWPSAMCT